MAKMRREFTPQFKREAVVLLRSSGGRQMQIPAELAHRIAHVLASRVPKPNCVNPSRRLFGRTGGLH